MCWFLKYSKAFIFRSIKFIAGICIIIGLSAFTELINLSVNISEPRETSLSYHDADVYVCTCPCAYSCTHLSLCMYVITPHCGPQTLHASTRMLIKLWRLLNHYRTPGLWWQINDIPSRCHLDDPFLCNTRRKGTRRGATWSLHDVCVSLVGGQHGWVLHRTHADTHNNNIGNIGDVYSMCSIV